MARSGVGNVAITASPIVFTTAPPSAATISLSNASLENAAAAGTKNIPAQIEQSEPRSVQKTSDHIFFVQTVTDREGECVDAGELAIQPPIDESLNRAGYIRFADSRRAG